MKLRIEDNGLVLTDVFSGIAIKTDSGVFGIAQRDGGIEVLRDGVLVWSSSPPATLAEAMEIAECGDRLEHPRVTETLDELTRAAAEKLAEQAAQVYSRATDALKTSETPNFRAFALVFVRSFLKRVDPTADETVIDCIADNLAQAFAYRRAHARAEAPEIEPELAPAESGN